MSGVSLLITTRNRTRLLEKSFEALEDKTMPNEIIIVDDGGTDDCKQLCEFWRDYEEYPIVYQYTKNPGDTLCCHARNVGLKLSKYDEILTCEPELMFITDCVAQLLEARKEFPNDMLHGYTWLAQDLDDTYESGRNIYSFFPYFLLMKKEWLFEIGGWDEFGFEGKDQWGWDDISLFDRLRYNNHDTQAVFEATGFHQWHPSRIESSVENEKYFRAYEYPKDLVANAGKEWGVPKK